MIECRRVSRSKAKRDGDFLMKNHQREVAASRMKAEKLKSLLTKLQDGERKSKLRNDNLLGDFGKVSEMASDLERKADKLRNVKRQYETYIDTVYPEWKENIESSRMDAIRRNAEIPDGQSSESPIQPVFEDHVQGEFPREFRDSVESDYQGNVLHSTAKYDGPIRMPKPFKPYKRRPSDRSPRNRFSEMTRNDYESSQNYTKSDSYYAKDTRDLVDDWRNLRMEIGEPNASSSYIRNGGFPQSHHHYSRSNLSGRESGNGVRSETFLQNRSNVLNLPEVDQRTDISGFTILPQALALSPDGRLVLLPMAFSPGMQVHNASHHGVSQTPQHERFAESATGGSVLVDEDRNRPMKADNWNSRSKTELSNGDTTSSIVEPRGSVENVTREPFVSVRESKDLDRRISQTENSRPGYEPVKDRNARKPSKNEDLNLKHISSVNSGDFPFSKPAETESTCCKENEYHMNNSDNNHNVKGNRTSIVKVADDDDKGEYSVESETRRAMPHRSAAENIENAKIAKSKNDENVAHGFDNDNVNINSDLSYEEVSGHRLDRGDIEENVAPTSLHGAFMKQHSSINAIPIEHEPIMNESRLQLQASVDSFAGEGETTNNDKSLNDFKAFDKSSDPTDGIPYHASDSRITETYPENFRNGDDSSSNHEEKISPDNFKAYYQAGISGNDVSVNEKETSFVAAEKLSNRRALSLESDENDLNTEPSRKEANKDEKCSCLDINDFSYLLEEVENRMGVAPKTEFYATAVGKPSKQLMEEIKTTVASAGSLEDIETQDLCSLAALDISERIKESGHDCILKEDADIEALSTVEDFRSALNPGFSDLWEYVFNHLELLVGNEIFDSVTAAEKFSRLLAPNSSQMQTQIQAALLRTLEISEEESIPLEVDGNESLNENGAEIYSNGKDELRDLKETEEASVGLGSNEHYLKEGLQADLDVKESSVEKAVPQSNKTGLVEREKEDKENDNVDNLSLDLGSVSNEDSSSTFDSTQFTARKEGNEQSAEDSRQNKEDEEKTDDVSSIESSEESTEEIPNEKDPPPEEKSNGKTDEITNHSSHHDSYDSDDDLDDLLNSSLAQSGNRNTLNIERKKEANGDKQENNQKKQLSVFNSNQNIPSEVTQDQNDNVSENSQRKDVLSPTSAKSISSKFRKPGFWENSDSESEAEELNVSGGHNLSNGNENDDDFDFEFYT